MESMSSPTFPGRGSRCTITCELPDRPCVFPINLLQGQGTGSKAVYVIDFTDGDGNSNAVPIYPDDGDKKFAQFHLTNESIKSATALKRYLEEQKRKGNLKFHTFKVIDVKGLRREDPIYGPGEPVKAKPHGFFIYRVLGPVFMYYRKKFGRKPQKGGK